MSSINGIITFPINLINLYWCWKIVNLHCVDLQEHVSRSFVNLYLRFQIAFKLLEVDRVPDMLYKYKAETIILSFSIVLTMKLGCLKNDIFAAGIKIKPCFVSVLFLSYLLISTLPNFINMHPYLNLCGISTDRMVLTNLYFLIHM